ncbi:ECF transporter S component [Azotosporobacter soli]|uniref:ECF transporter S component n=1 Tax=Azotosporobacter soli TaxID=3055040 RepID=UPI0031FF3408
MVREDNKTKYLTKVAMLSAIAVLLMYIEVPVPLMPGFLKLDASELPAVIGAFALGPLGGIWIEMIKNLLHGMNSQTMGIGETANFLVGVSFVVPSSLLYRRSRTTKGAILALTAGTMTMVFTASLLNYFVLLPLYQLALHFPLEKVVALGSAANPKVVDLASFIAWAIAPFNLLKGVAVSLLTLAVYRRVAPIVCQRG